MAPGLVHHGESADTRTFDITSLDRTAALARALTAIVRTGDVIGLRGDLGSGKTTFARFFIRTLGGDDQEVPSPTFNLVQVYAYADIIVWHFDFYRLQRFEESYELGLEDAYAEGISLVEWPERLGPELPPDRLDIEFVLEGPDGGRTARLSAHGSWRGRLEAIEIGNGT